MSLPNFQHEFADAAGKRPHTTIDVAYPGDGNQGKITLSISSNRTPQERAEAMAEYKDLAHVLKFEAHLDKEKGTLTVHTGSRSPEGLVLMISNRLEDSGLVQKGEGHHAIAAMMNHEETQLGIASQAHGNPMMAALKQAQSLKVAHASIQHTTEAKGHTEPVRERLASAAVVEPGNRNLG